ncbi:hypothetical protein [Geomicrobium sp. JCM 19055]|uniref:hypothetical protein n=1 Tax=Geomicrobium sp. JCM 19055 TaxID=1460649 RepID=UPI00045ED16A|nr:hypothetical protein [Geomicrobium sp. JCM 19055]GAK00723.1 hypothetical protein JCM19055_3833 [Geomicrobium sp. JCM 19055]
MGEKLLYLFYEEEMGDYEIIQAVLTVDYMQTHRRLGRLYLKFLTSEEYDEQIEILREYENKNIVLSKEAQAGYWIYMITNWIVAREDIKVGNIGKKFDLWLSFE